MSQRGSQKCLRTVEKWVVLPLKFSNWDLEPWVVPMHSVVMSFEAAVVLEPTIALRTGDH